MELETDEELLQEVEEAACTAVACPEIKLLTTSYDLWMDSVKAACQSHRRTQWLVGDLLVFGERNFSMSRAKGEGYGLSKHKFTYDAVAKETSYEITALYDIASVARSVPVSVRTEELTWSHHRCVRALEPERQKYWLDVAVAWKFSVARLKFEIYTHDGLGALPQSSFINDGEKLLLPPVVEKSGKAKIPAPPKELKTLEKKTHLAGLELRALNKFAEEKHVPADVAIRALVVIGLHASGHLQKIVDTATDAIRVYADAEQLYLSYLGAAWFDEPNKFQVTLPSDEEIHDSNESSASTESMDENPKVKRYIELTAKLLLECADISVADVQRVIGGKLTEKQAAFILKEARGTQ